MSFSKPPLKGIVKEIKQYEYHHHKTVIFFLVTAAAILVLDPQYFNIILGLIRNSGNYGLIGVAIAGFFFAYGLTVPVAAVALYAFGSVYNPFLVAAIAAASATAGDFIIFKIAKLRFAKHIEKLKRRGLLRRYSKWIHRFAPILAGFIIASPLPDELAAIFLGSLRFTEKQFVIFVYGAEFIGILIIASTGMALI